MRDPKVIAKQILSVSNYYQIPYTTDRGSVKRLRQFMANLHDDAELLLSALDPEFRTEELDKRLVALKELSNSKTLNDNRVRFWINLMNDDMKMLAEKVNES
jgi:hypothetical protein